MIRKISKWILKIWGYSIEGDIPYGLQKYVLAVAPHTSAWDFPVGILVRTTIGIKMNVVAKASLFRPPFGFFFRWLGVFPVDRSKRNNFVQSVINLFNSNDYFALVIAPEGTRKKVKSFKTGFYYIAKGAEVPIVLVRFDLKNKVISFRKAFYPTEDKEADFELFHNYFKTYDV